MVNDELQLQHRQQKRHTKCKYILLETQTGKKVLVRFLEHQRIQWVIGHAVERSMPAQRRILYSGDCRRSRRTLTDIRRHLQTFAMPGQGEESNKRCLGMALYGFLNCIPGSLAPSVDWTVPFGNDEQIKAQFQSKGFVVVRDVFSEEAIDAAVEELWASPALLGRSKLIRRDDPLSWGSADWPQQGGGKNFLESLDPYSERSCWELVQCPNAIHVLKLLWRTHGVDDLVLAEAPRYGVMRPTAENKEWRTQESWLHWDQNPWTQPGFHRVQAFACLSAQTETSGGLLCVPGFQEHWEQWGRDNPEEALQRMGIGTSGKGDGSPLPVPEMDSAHQAVIKVLAPKGALVLWDGRLPHQNFPNTGNQFRLVMYLNFVPATKLPTRPGLEAQERRRLMVRRVLGKESVFWPTGLTSLGRSVCCAPDRDEPDLDTIAQEALVEAIRLTQEACALESQGSATKDPEERRQLFDKSMETHVKAERVFPDIASWHSVIC